jgi:hypothetical protein
MMQKTLDTSTYFATPLYSIMREDYLPTLTPIFDEYVEKSKEQKPMNDIHPVVMTNDMSQDPRLSDFTSYILGTAWNILQSQGNKVDNQMPYFHSLWGQQHHKTSDMSEHIHNDGTHIVGFYFIDCPENSPLFTVHDPRYGKRQINLPESDVAKISFASNAVSFPPQKGMFVFANSWLPHSFGRHAGEQPFKFLHFNINLQQFVPQVDAPIVI